MATARCGKDFLVRLSWGKQKWSVLIVGRTLCSAKIMQFSGLFQALDGPTEKRRTTVAVQGKMIFLDIFI